MQRTLHSFIGHSYSGIQYFSYVPSRMGEGVGVCNVNGLANMSERPVTHPEELLH